MLATLRRQIAAEARLQMVNTTRTYLSSGFNFKDKQALMDLVKQGESNYLSIFAPWDYNKKELDVVSGQATPEIARLIARYKEVMGQDNA